MQNDVFHIENTMSTLDQDVITFPASRIALEIVNCAVKWRAPEREQQAPGQTRCSVPTRTSRHTLLTSIVSGSGRTQFEKTMKNNGFHLTGIRTLAGTGARLREDIRIRRI